jgi:hypothetical protein
MKLLAMFVFLFTITLSSQAQKSKTRTKIKTNGEDELDFFQCYEGGACTFTILKGDTLVYEVNQKGKSYQMFIIPNKFTANAVADFNWYTSAPDSRSGKVSINAVGLKTGSNLITNLPTGELKITDATSTMWISEKEFKEITKGGTSMGIDGSVPEVFASPEADAANVTITYKTRSIDLDAFLVQSKEVTKSKKELAILNISDNLLIVKAELDNGSMVLKEVRQNNSRY